MEKVLCSAQAQAEINKLNERKNELEASNAELRKSFETQNIEERDTTLKQVEENQNELSKILEDINTLNARKAKLEEEEKFMSLSNKLANPEVRKNDKYDTPEYRSAYRAMIMGDDSEMRGLTTSTAKVPVPTYLQTRIETAWDKYGHILNRCSITTIKGIISVPYEKSADAAGYHDENTAEPTEENITFEQTLLQPCMVKKWISITDELKALTDEEFMDYVADEVVYQIALFVDKEIVSGKGKSGKGFVGVTEAALTEKVELAATFNTVNEALVALKDELVNPVVIMAKKTFMSTFMALKDTAGRPIFQVQTDNKGEVRYFLNGLPVEFTSALKDYEAATAQTDAYMVVGEMSAYRANFPEGRDIKLLFDPYTLATQDKERIIGRLFGAGNVIKPKRLVKVVKPSA